MKKLLFVLLLGTQTLLGQNMLINGTDKLSLLGCSIQSGTIHITGTGNIQANKAYFNSETTLEELDMNLHVRVDSLDASGGYLFGIGKYSGIAGTEVEFSGTDSTTSIIINKLSSTTPTLAVQYMLPFKLTLGLNYKIRIGKRIRKLVIEVTSPDSTEYHINDTLSYPTPFFGCLWGTPFVGCETGSVSVTDFTMTTPFNLNPRLSVWGDSFIEGNALDSDVQRYVSLIKDSIGHQNIAILGRGGENSSSVDTRFPQESRWFKGSKYALLALGVNDINSVIWRTNLLNDIDSLKQHNIIPILVTITPRSDRLSFIAQANSWLRNTYNGAVVDLTKAVSTTGETHWQTGMGTIDSIHPSPAGHLAMYNRIKLEAPYIFRDNDVFNIDYFNETTMENVGDSLKYSTLSNFSTSTAGSNIKMPVIPGNTTFFKDTIATPGINILYDILAAPNRPSAPTNPAIDGSAETFDWTNNPFFTNVSDYEYSLDSGATWATCSTKPISSPGTVTLQLRVKATVSNFKSNMLFFDATYAGILSPEKPAISAYPNPITDELIIKNISEETTVTICSVDGRFVKALILHNNATNTVNTNELSPGFYIFTLRSKTINHSFKILKQ